MTIGILLSNIGTPDAPTSTAVRKYLHEFLSDPRVVEIPAFLWKPILHGFILRFRPKHSAALYQKIWNERGSPLLANTVDIAKTLEERLSQQLNQPVVVAVGMRYGNPSIESALQQLCKQKVTRILVFPLYPQYSGTTTASTFDRVATILKKYRYVPEIRTIHNYAKDALYIKALTHSIQAHWEKNSKKYLLFSFHGIPKRNITLGDPYETHCQKTAQAVASALQLSADEWSISFQSRLGRAKWLMPYTADVLATLPSKGIHHLQVICPGFSVDCLETLEEIAIRGREQFLKGGGKSFDYIPALNNHPHHIDALANLIERNVQGWI